MISKHTIQHYVPLMILASFILGFVVVITKPSLSLPNLTESITNNQMKPQLKQSFASYSEEIEESGEEVVFDLVADESTISLFEGVETQVWSYNGQVPGPEIRVKLGQRVTVNFINNLPQPTTIHWHGVRVPNEMDGVPDITQDPIQPGDSFTYSFVPKDAGTFWFHPHVRGAEQVEKGLYGTLIVEDPSEPQFDSDTVFVVDDWRLQQNGQIDPRFVTNHDLAHDGRWGNAITVNGSTNKQASFSAGASNRLRFVNTSNGRVYRLDFGGLANNAQVIAVDGMKVGEVFPAQGFELAPGNRVDVVLQIPDSMAQSSFTVYDTFTRNRNSLFNITIGDLTTTTFSGDLPVDSSFPDWSEANKLKPNAEYVLNARRTSGMGMMGIEWTINGQAYPNVNPITLKHNEIQKIRFTNKSARLHPMHLHGQFFQVIARNGQPVDEPYWRDTVLLHPRETVDIVLLPLDKGTWANHCHILEHAEAGMMTVVEVK